MLILVPDTKEVSWYLVILIIHASCPRYYDMKLRFEANASLRAFNDGLKE